MNKRKENKIMKSISKKIIRKKQLRKQVKEFQKTNEMTPEKVNVNEITNE